jgi:chorismate mutase/prephenate dehydratase
MSATIGREALHGIISSLSITMRPSSSSGKYEEPHIVVAYQGLEQSFTYLAGTAFFKAHEKKVTYNSERHLKDVVEKVAGGSADYGVVPLESSSHGSIYGVYDILLNLEGKAWIVGEIGKMEEHCLCAVARGRNTAPNDSDIAEVFGHPHILECCSEYLDALDAKRPARDLPDLKRHPTTDSAEACMIVAAREHPTAAAIASAEAAQAHGLVVCKTSIGNDRNAEVKIP